MRERERESNKRGGGRFRNWKGGEKLELEESIRTREKWFVCSLMTRGR